MFDRSLQTLFAAGVGALLLFGVVFLPSTAKGETLTLYVSPSGSDAWSGKAADASGADGPFASIERARDEIRKHKAAGGVPGPVDVLIRGGMYYLDHTIQFDERDSGSADAPISYRAHPGEIPELVGGRRLTDFRMADNGVAVYTLPTDRKWGFRSLFVDGKRQIRARYPNFDPNDPYREGFNYTGRCEGCPGRTVGNIHSAGDQLEYTLDVPADGTYAVWMNYAAFNVSYDMSGRVFIVFDGKTPIQLESVPNTASWKDLQWKRVTSIWLKAGRQRLVFKNEKGGGLNLSAFALTDDSAWQPEGMPPAPVSGGDNLILVHAEDFVATNTKNLILSGGSFNISEFYYNLADLGTLSADMLTQGIEVHIFPSAAESCRAFKEIVSIQSVDASSRKITIEGSEADYGIGIGDRYFFENAMAFLDAPEEWFRNENKTLSYKPGKGFSAQSEVIVPVIGRMMDFSDASFITVRELTFRATDYSPEDGCAGYNMGNTGVVTLENAENCAVEECRFTNNGPYAVYVRGGKSNRIVRNHISDSAEGGVLLHDTTGNEISDNTIYDGGLVYKHVGGIVLQGNLASENTIAHNEIRNISRYGISLKHAGTANLVEFNRVSNTNLETYDTGGIEVTQHDKTFISNSIIRNNIVADTVGYSAFKKNVPLFLSWGIYLDSYAGGYTIENNIVFRNHDGGIMIQGGKQNAVRNNIFADSDNYQIYIANYLDNSENNIVEKNVISYSNPIAATILARPLGKNTLRMGKNIYFGSSGQKLIVVSPDFPDFEAWQKNGYDADSVIADPLFTNKEADDYTLKPASPAFKMGFRQISADPIGPRISFPAALRIRNSP